MKKPSWLYFHLQFCIETSQKPEPWSITPNVGLLVKMMLCIWWNWKRVLYYEPFLENQMINSNKWCSQSDQLKAALDEKDPELVNRMHYLPSGLQEDRLVVGWPDRNTACLESSDTSTMFIRHCTFRFPLISVFTNFS